MPVLTTTGPPAVVDLASRLVSDLQAGRAGRETIGARAVAFGWTTGLPRILATLVNGAVVDGLSFRAVRVVASGTPAARVAEKGPKPAAVTITSETVPLSKYAGLGTFTSEQQLDTDGLVPALTGVIVASGLMAYDADCAATLGADHGHDVGGADWPAGILAGTAAVAGAGAAPSVLAVSAADYAAVVQSPGVGYAMSPTDGVPAMWGLAIVLMSGLVAGTAYVLDPAACLAVEHVDSPAAVVDPYSGLGTNEVRLAVEMFAGFVVTAPGGVAEVTVSGAAVQSTGGGGASSAKSRAAYALGA